MKRNSAQGLKEGFKTEQADLHNATNLLIT